MRLGYLTDLDSILCTRSDPERGFQAGDLDDEHLGLLLVLAHDRLATTVAPSTTAARWCRPELLSPGDMTKSSGPPGLSRGA